eukprot:4236683-Pleurochrysis_carterae.AAC.7
MPAAKQTYSASASMKLMAQMTNHTMGHLGCILLTRPKMSSTYKRVASINCLHIIPRMPNERLLRTVLKELASNNVQTPRALQACVLLLASGAIRDVLARAVAIPGAVEGLNRFMLASDLIISPRPALYSL